ncbi:2-keto-4-pentenoate hydratase [Brevibacterium yomogidense]|uniref:2-keto-4-pentenoate hydratase n=1 Tax=Brevibacterium yomogidense TaxID=946573 RepID=UPI0018E01C3E|nr:2-oxo-hepta-3-ene-1,7-dioate hydratase [Brevibacterium yomogidense]
MSLSEGTAARGLPDDQVKAIADELADAARTGTRIDPPSRRFPAMTVADSYAVQRLWRDRREAEGGTVAGFKIGLTSVAMQQAFGLDEPDYGVIFEDQVLAAGVTVPAATWNHARVEVELSFVLDSPLVPGAGSDAGGTFTAADVLAATRCVVPSLEVLDCHVVEDGMTVVDTISDNAALGAVILGDEEFDATVFDLSWIGAKLFVNGLIVETGVSGAVLGHPAASAAWMANRFAERGEEIPAGALLLSGSFTRPVPVAAGDTVIAEYQGMGEVRVQFT